MNIIKFTTIYIMYWL